MTSHLHTAILTIDLKALSKNYLFLKSQVNSHCIVAGVVKANAYGLGLKPVVRTLLSEGCPQFFVATLNEALEFRTFEPHAPVAVLGGLFTDAEDIYIKNNIQPVINSLNDLARWQGSGVSADKSLPTILHIDTGMNRLGLSPDDVQKLKGTPKLYQNLDIEWVMSHFACADDSHHPMTVQQYDLFKKCANNFPKAKRSLGNSSGTFRGVHNHINMIRPGVALYGGNPTPELKNPMQQVIKLKAKVLQIRECEKGDSIGYGASHVFKKNTQTATIGIGYADGFSRADSNKGQLFFNNTPCPILGRISMDLTTIDVSQCKIKPKQGDWVEVIGKNQTIDDFAKNANTISYEILTSLGNRYAREYIE